MGGFLNIQIVINTTRNYDKEMNIVNSILN